MLEVPWQIQRMRRGAQTRRPPSRVPPAAGNFLAELSSFIPLSSSKNNHRREEGGGWWGWGWIIHRECFFKFLSKKKFKIQQEPGERSRVRGAAMKKWRSRN